MKAYDLTIFIIIFSMLLTMFNVMFLPDGGFVSGEMKDIKAVSLPTSAEVSSSPVTALVDLAFMSFTLIPALFLFCLKAMLAGIFVIGQLGLPEEFEAIIQAMFVIIYAAAGVQLWLNRSISTSE